MTARIRARSSIISGTVQSPPRCATRHWRRIGSKTRRRASLSHGGILCGGLAEWQMNSSSAVFIAGIGTQGGGVGLFLVHFAQDISIQVQSSHFDKRLTLLVDRVCELRPGPVESKQPCRLNHQIPTRNCHGLQNDCRYR
jgi:hypothetical protein